ncbi:unnamed protein product, partial [Staurois parvus]
MSCQYAPGRYLPFSVVSFPFSWPLSCPSDLSAARHGCHS